MPKLTRSYPAYTKHRASGQAVVTLDGRDVYLGPHGSRASRAEYDRLIGEWLAAGRRHPAATDLTVAELAVRFLEHAQTYYRHPDGTPTSELSAYKLPVGVLVRLYGRTPAADFGPLAMDAVRNAMIAKGWARRSINLHTGRLKRLFKWGVSKEIVPPSVHQALTAVSGLRAGRSAARESDPVRPVPDAAVGSTLPHLSPVVAAMVKLQLLTGARPGEICGLRTTDVDRTGEVWTITPARHKTQHHGHARTIHVGPQAQAVLLPFLNAAEPAVPCFSPATAERERRARQHAARVTPAGYGNGPGTNRARRPRKAPGDRYDVGSYRRAIANACRAAFPPPAPLARVAGETVAAHCGRLTADQRVALAAWHREHAWHPHQLRHTAATAIRRRFGIEAAQHVLGHATLSVTEVYAERNAEAARAVAAAIG